MKKQWKQITAFLLASVLMLTNAGSVMAAPEDIGAEVPKEERIFDEEKGIYVDEYDTPPATPYAVSERTTINPNANAVFGDTDVNVILNAYGSYLNSPYVFGGATPSGWDCSGYITYVARNHLGVDMGRNTIDIDNYCNSVGALCATGRSAEEFNADYTSGIIKPGDIVIMYNSAGNSVHAGIIGTDYSIYHAWGAGASAYWFIPAYSSWCDGVSTVRCRFDKMWQVDGGHGKVYQSYNVYRGVQDKGSLAISKKSANPDLTNNNGLYSLKGAKYGLYSGNKLVATLVTDKNGYAKVDGLKSGNYTLKELEAPKGFAIDLTVHSVTVRPNKTTTVNVQDIPQNDPVSIVLGKVDAETNQNKPQGSASLAGAEFTLKYYSVMSDTDPALAGEKPMRTWVLKTNAEGKTAMVDSLKVSGDEFFKDSNGYNTLPLGTLTIQETKAPVGYLLNNEVFVRKITSKGDAEGVETYSVPTVPETPQKGIIRLQKESSDANYGKLSLAGAVYEVHNSAGELVDTLKTNAEGKAETKELPLGTYTVKEITSPTGFMVDETTYTVNLTPDNATDQVFYKTVKSVEIPLKGIIQLEKKSTEADNGISTLKGAVYEVRNNSDKVVDTLTTDANGQASSKELPWGTYTVKEIENPTGFLMDKNTYTVDLTTTDKSQRVFYKSVTSEEVPQKGIIELQKVDSETDKNTAQGAATLKDAKYDIFLKSAYQAGDNTESESYKGTLTTDKNGKAKSQELPLDTYYVIERKSSEGYLIDSNVYEVTLSAKNKTDRVFAEKVTSDEDIIRGNVEIIKLKENEDDENETLQGLKGVEFTFTSDTTGKAVKKITTDKYGFATTADKDNPRGGLLFDTYTVTETKCPEGLKPIEPFKVTISEEGVTLKGIYKEDKLIVSPVTVVKVDKSTGKVIPAANTEFKLLDANKKQITMTTYYPNKVEHKTFKTNENGQFTFPDKLKYGTYYLEEVKAPHGYLKGELLQFSVTESSDWEHPMIVKYSDENAMGKVSVFKVDDTTQKPIPAGVKFEIIAAEDIITPDGTLRASKGDVVDTIVTGDNSKAESKLLFLGKYTLKETKSIDGYLLNEKPVSFELKYKDQKTAIVSVSETIGNEPGMGQIIINKFDATTDKKIPAGAEFEVRAATDIITPDGTVRAKKGEIVDTISVKEKGTVTSKKLFLGTYEVQETKAPAGYVLNETVFPVELKYADQNTQVVFESVNVKDDPALGTISIEKEDSLTGDALANATFEISAAEDIVTPDGTVRAKKGEVVDTITTDENGKATSQELFLGKYIVKESKQPQGYILSKDHHYVELEYAGQDTPLVSGSIVVKNKPTELEIIKTDENKKALEGVTFRLWNKAMAPAENETDKETGDDVLDNMGVFDENVNVDSGMNAVSEYKTDADGKINLKYLSPGTYCVQEVKADGYVVDKTVYEVVIDENGQVDDEDKGVLKLSNKPNEVVIVKTDKDTKEPMKGVTFKVWNKSVTDEEDGAIGVATESTTDKNGKIKLNKLVPGTYCIQEVETLPGYVLEDTITEFTVAEDGRIDGKDSVVIDRTNIFTKVDFTKHDITTGKEIEGGKYRVEDQDGNVIDSWEGSGKAHRIDKLVVGKTYYFIEEVAPEGYLITEKVEFKVEKTGDVQKVKMHDEPAMGKIRIEKKNAETKDPLNGAEFEITAAENIVTPDGTVRVKKGEVVDTLTTVKGEAETKSLFLGKYTVKETKQPDGFLLDEKEWNVELKYKDQDTKVVLETISVENKPTSVEIVKTDEDGKALEGVTFEVWNKAMRSDNKTDDTVDGTIGVVSEYITDKDGKITFQRLIPGTYCVQETKTVPGHVLDDTITEFTISKDGTIDGKENLTLNFKNTYTKVLISKTDITGDKELPGAKLQVIEKESGEIVEAWTSTEEAHLIKRMKPGKYILHEEIAPKGYAVANDIEFEVKETDEIQKVTMIDELLPGDAPVKTGDNMHMLPWILIMLFTAGTIITVIGMRIRDKRFKKKK